MRSGEVTKHVADRKIFIEKIGRKSLHLLQPAATDKENLVGAGRNFHNLNTSKHLIKNEMSDKVKGDINQLLNRTVVVQNDVLKSNVDKINIELKKIQKFNKNNEIIFNDKSVQTDIIEKINISSEDLTFKVSPSENYWAVLAERRRIALQDALSENQILSNQICIYKEMLDHSKALVEVLKEMLGDDRSDINNSLEDNRQ